MNVMYKVVFAAFAAAALGSATAKTVRFDFPQWETNTWVFLPACAYNGNRDAVGIDAPYPPGQTAAGRGENPRREICAQIPRLEPDGSGEIEVTSGDMSVPCAGFWFPSAKKGVLVFTEAQYKGESIGYTVRSGRLTLDYPARRKNGYRWNARPCPDPDRGNVPAPEDYRPKIRRIDFAAADVTAFIERFFRERKCVMSTPRATGVYSKELLDETLDSWNKNLFVEGAYCQERLKWVPGWTGGPVAVYPLYKFGDAATKARCRQTIDFMISHQTAAGVYVGLSVGEGRKLKPRPNARPGDVKTHMLRLHCDGLWNLFECFKTMEPTDAWKSSAHRGADVLVEMWRRYGQFGQWVDPETLEMLVGRTDSCAIAPAALVSAWRFFGDAKYLEVAEAACTDYCRRDLERGVVYGGPGDCLAAPDSESVVALLESCVALAEATGRKQYLDWARAAAALTSTWVMTYGYAFPAKSPMARHHVNSTGSVFANVQNKHSAPGFCTLSGKGLLKLYRMTGDVAYLELLKDVASYIPQSVSRKANPFELRKGGVLTPGFLCERVNTSDWEGKENVGDALYEGSCWCGSSLLATWADLLDEPEFAGFFSGVETRVQKDVPYAAAARCKLDVKWPVGQKNFPTVVWFHGGGLESGKRHFIPIDDSIAQVAVDYRLLGAGAKKDGTVCIRDAAAAVAWTLDNIGRYGGDTNRVFVSGMSAGGYLTMMVGMAPQYLKERGHDLRELAGLAPISGQATKHYNVRKYGGDTDPQFRPKIDELAPLNWCSKDIPPIISICGEEPWEWKCRNEENRLLISSCVALGHTNAWFVSCPYADHSRAFKAGVPYVELFVKGRLPAPLLESFRQIPLAPYGTPGTRVSRSTTRTGSTDTRSPRRRTDNGGRSHDE